MFEPALSRKEDDISHPAFNNLFLKYSMSDNGDIIIRRNKRGNIKEMYLTCNMLVDGSPNNEIEFEIDNSKVHKMIERGLPFSNELGLVTSPCVAMKRKIKIKENEELTVNFIISVSEDLKEAQDNLDYYKSQENVKREFNISKAKAEEEARYLSLGRKDLEVCQAVLPYIMYQNPTKSLYLESLLGKEYKQSNFWKYGISGDVPLMLVLIKSANDVYVVKEMLKIHEYLRIKGIKTDLVILDYEKNVYEQYVKEQIIQEILNMQIGYLQNISGGIFLLNKNEIVDEDLFKLKASIIVPANKGNVLENIKELENEFKKNLPPFGKNKTHYESANKFEIIKPNININELKYYNGYGGFSTDRKRVYYKNKSRKHTTSVLE